MASSPAAFSPRLLPQQAALPVRPFPVASHGVHLRSLPAAYLALYNTVTHRSSQWLRLHAQDLCQIKLAEAPFPFGSRLYVLPRGSLPRVTLLGSALLSLLPAGSLVLGRFQGPTNNE